MKTEIKAAIDGLSELALGATAFLSGEQRKKVAVDILSYRQTLQSALNQDAGDLEACKIDLAKRFNLWNDIDVPCDIVCGIIDHLAAQGYLSQRDKWLPIEQYTGYGVVIVSRWQDNWAYTPITSFKDATGVWRVYGSLGGNCPLPFEPTVFRHNYTAAPEHSKGE